MKQPTSFEIREYRREDRAALVELWSLTFAGGRPIPETTPLCSDSDSIYVADKHGRLVGGYLIRNLTITRGGARLTCGGLSYMTVAPECRGQGIGVKLIRDAIDRLRRGNWHMTSGFASRESVYRKFGWECAGRRMRIECPNQRYPRLVGTLPIRRLSIHDWPALEPAYSKFTDGRSGMVLRDDLRFSRGLFPILGLAVPGVEPIVLAAGEPIEAYAILPISGETWSRQEVSELVWSTPGGYRSILAAVTRYAANQNSLVWFEPSDGPFLSFGLDRGIDCRIVAPFGPRIINVPAAIAALKPSTSGSFTLTVQDEEIAENRGPWRITFSPEQVEVEPWPSAEIETETGPFVQALLGEPSFETLLNQGFVRSASEKAAREASRLFSAMPTYCLDFF